MSLLAQRSLFPPTLILPKPVFCLSADTTFLFLPNIAVCGRPSASLSSAPSLKCVTLVAFPNEFWRADTFSQSGLPVSALASPAAEGCVGLSDVSDGEPGNKIKFHCLDIVSLKAREENVSRIFCKGLLSRSAQGRLNHPHANTKCP